ncbi:unnamed protein product [Sphagnum jensenii]|uniref:Uncharacterized protein n=1 Tax=Sphagnum jensenii TaxID=128206 RepID=A0ABP0V8E8_9BRYO
MDCSMAIFTVAISLYFQVVGSESSISHCGKTFQKSRDQLANMVMALLTEDYETLCLQYAELGAAVLRLILMLFNGKRAIPLPPYLGLALKDLNIGKF